ncbi:hypothetical protein M1O20_04060 [Dehalococcoidia bacterium]|nr:hypothetical protein [Dehalococcoidia bacterium]MCL0082238.1 hypothetical protein [Dehalococcoidia bacterium]
MMNLSYYPGCTLKTKARNFEDSAIASMAVLGIDLVELPPLELLRCILLFGRG